MRKGEEKREEKETERNERKEPVETFHVSSEKYK